MIRGTTPTFTLKLKNKDGTPSEINLNEANDIYFSISQNGRSIVKTGEEIQIENGNTVLVFLTQKESLSLREGQKTEIQLNWTYINDGKVKRAATKVCEIELGKQLYKEEIQ